MQKTKKKLAIRFGLGGIKAVGIGMMESAVKERLENGEFQDIYNFCERLNAKNINKKSIEALAKSGAFDCFGNDRRQIHDSFDILSRYAAQKSDEASSNQMSLFSGIVEDKAPPLKNPEKWTKSERLQKEFEAFGFFLNEHPLDDVVHDLKRRGVIFSKKIEAGELEDNWIIKISGAVASSKHRSGSKGRFAYITMSDPLGIYEILIFDEELITNSRDRLEDGSLIVVECLIKKDDGGTRLLAREITDLQDFLKNTPAHKHDFEDIKKQRKRSDSERNNPYLDKEKANQKAYENHRLQMIEQIKTKKIFSAVEIFFQDREAIFAVKSILSQKLIAQDIKAHLTKTTKVYLTIAGGKIQLEEDYFLDLPEVEKIRQIEQIIEVKTFD